MPYNDFTIRELQLALNQNKILFDKSKDTDWEIINFPYSASFIMRCQNNEVKLLRRSCAVRLLNEMEKRKIEKAIKERKKINQTNEQLYSSNVNRDLYYNLLNNIGRTNYVQYTIYNTTGRIR